MPPLPLGAKTIGREWPIEEGGFGATAKTDEAGQPIIGLYPLNRNGQPCGQASEYFYQHLMIRIVAGYDNRYKAVVVYADVEVTTHGMNLRVLVPPHLMERGLDRYLSAAWGSAPPQTYEAPTNANWLVMPVPQVNRCVPYLKEPYALPLIQLNPTE